MTKLRSSVWEKSKRSKVHAHLATHTHRGTDILYTSFTLQFQLQIDFFFFASGKVKEHVFQELLDGSSLTADGRFMWIYTTIELILHCSGIHDLKREQ